MCKMFSHHTTVFRCTMYEQRTLLFSLCKAENSSLACTTVHCLLLTIATQHIMCSLIWLWQTHKQPCHMFSLTLIELNGISTCLKIDLNAKFQQPNMTSYPGRKAGHLWVMIARSYSSHNRLFAICARDVMDEAHAASSTQVLWKLWLFSCAHVVQMDAESSELSLSQIGCLQMPSWQHDHCFYHCMLPSLCLSPVPERAESCVTTYSGTISSHVWRLMFDSNVAVPGDRSRRKCACSGICSLRGIRLQWR